jgi:hypothetical protein
LLKIDFMERIWYRDYFKLLPYMTTPAKHKNRFHGKS